MKTKMYRLTVFCVMILSLSILLNYWILYSEEPTELSLEEIINSAIAKHEELTDYQCIMTAFNKVGKTTDTKIYEYYFKKPKKIRMKIIKGENEGAELVFKDNKVRAHRGGLLSFITLTFNPNDEKVVSIRGARVDESDWDAILSRVKKYKTMGSLRLIGTDTVDKRLTYLIELLPKEEPIFPPVTKELVWIDTQLWVPIKTAHYEDEELVHTKTYKNIKLDIGIKDKFFDM